MFYLIRLSNSTLKEVNRIFRSVNWNHCKFLSNVFLWTSRADTERSLRDKCRKFFFPFEFVLFFLIVINDAAIWYRSATRYGYVSIRKRTRKNKCFSLCFLRHVQGLSQCNFRLSHTHSPADDANRIEGDRKMNFRFLKSAQSLSALSALRRGHSNPLIHINNWASQKPIY